MELRVLRQILRPHIKFPSKVKATDIGQGSGCIASYKRLRISVARKG
jgi:hypothetical protein